MPGLVTLAHLIRAALLVWAFRLWYGISRDDLAGRGRAWLTIALLTLTTAEGAAAGGGLFLGYYVCSRAAWTRELSGWPRVAVALGAPLFLVLLSVWPQAHVRGSGLEGQLLPILVSPVAPLMGGTLPPGLATELALCAPLESLSRALLQLFRVQLVVLTVRAYTLPLRLHGMSLRRRFTVNYLFIRSVPSVLATLTLLVAAYVGLGLYQASRAREALERRLERADAVATALLDDPRTARAGPGAGAVLDSARAWLGAEGARAHLVLRAGGSAVGREAIGSPVATTGTPGTFLALADSASGTASGRGVVVADSALYLYARRMASRDTTRSLALYMPLDSTALRDVAGTIGARVSVGIDDRRNGLRYRLDPRPTAMLQSSRPAGSRERGIFLGRSYLPLGDWGAPRTTQGRGAIVLELHATQAFLIGAVSRIPGWLASNALMLLLLVVLTTLFGAIEGLAVRSGRGVVQSIEEEVGSLREAATRFGAGELAHRIPVRGTDELSVLAGSLNEMAASLERQRTELIEKERLDEDLEVALSIQRRFLPQHPPAVAGLDVAGTSVPSREVGGDLFHYLELPGGRLALALGDVAGKSVPAALIMSNVMAALRAEVQHEAEVEKSLERVNRLLVEQVEPGRFVTLFYGIVDPGRGTLRYTSAGHNPPLRLSAGGGVTWLDQGGVPLGIRTDARYPVAEVPFAPGDVLVVYSDGVTEAEGPERKGAASLFGEERLADVVAGLAARPAREVVEGVLTAVQAFAGDRPQTDDVTLVVVRRL
jgi:serine phosphatase RsbU (regulator of sigma subunit)